MAPRITREVRLDTPGPARKFVRPIASRIAWELEAENAGQIREAGATVSYRRGYSIRYKHGLFASFDPGEFVVEADGRTVVIRYSLGLGPALFVASLLPLGFAYAFYVSRELGTVLMVFAGIAAALGTGFAVNLWKIRGWLRTAAEAAIARASRRTSYSAAAGFAASRPLSFVMALPGVVITRRPSTG